MAITEILKEKIRNEIEDSFDFDYMMEQFKTSNAPMNDKDEAVSYLKKQYPQFDVSNHSPSREVVQMIKDGESDISDMGGFG